MNKFIMYMTTDFTLSPPPYPPPICTLSQTNESLDFPFACLGTFKSDRCIKDYVLGLFMKKKKKKKKNWKIQGNKNTRQ